MASCVKTKKIGGYEIKPPKKKAFQIETPPDQICLHTLLVASGKRGGGKSVAVSNLCAKLFEQGVLDRCILISPTYFSNKEIFAPLNINEDDDVLEPEKDVVKVVIQKVEEEKKDYDEFVEKLKKYNLFQKMMKSKKPINTLDPALLVEFLELGFLDPFSSESMKRPEWKYKHERPPRVMCIIDDCLGTPLMNPKSGLVNLCIKHRHVAQGMGLSICLLVQSYCAVGGIPRPVRENCTAVLFFKCKDENQIRKIHEEIGADVDLEQFDRLYKYATEEPYGFLMVDFHPKDKSKMFRKNFNEYLSADACAES